MKKILAFEGIDGSGKGTLIEVMGDLARKRGMRCRTIGRREADSAPWVGEITNLVQSYATKITTSSDLHLRIAREFARAELAREADEDLIFLDRFLLSVFTRSTANGASVDHVRQLLAEVFDYSGLHGTVFVSVPFDIAWGRVQNAVSKGDRQLSPKEQLGVDRNRAMAACLESEFHRGLVTGKKFLVTNTGTIDQAKVQLEELLSDLYL